MNEPKDLVRQLLDLCERANTVMMGDTKHDGGEPEDDWIADYEAIRDEAQCAAGNHLYSTNWKDGKAYDYCPFCSHEPNDKVMAAPSQSSDLTASAPGACHRRLVVLRWWVSGWDRAFYAGKDGKLRDPHLMVKAARRWGLAITRLEEFKQSRHNNPLSRRA